LRFNKRASLEISIQAIVIVVLAMTLLGLGLTFIRKQFSGLGSIQEEITEQVKQKILNDLIENDKKLSFSRTEIEIDKGESEVLTIGVRNKNDELLSYEMIFEPISDPEGGPFTIENPNWFQYAQGQFYELAPAESSVRNVRLTIPPNIPRSGSYFLNFIVKDEFGVVYDSKDFFVVVRG